MERFLLEQVKRKTGAAVLAVALLFTAMPPAPVAALPIQATGSVSAEFENKAIEALRQLGYTIPISRTLACGRID
ncbi:hypothetical protein CGZ75_17540 [Paenibacillus herberti]|uniref:Uncharacterized protein n=1 Tax=Paenibacillus herberti TaxID=1619309 RepID=A0A229NXP6_9BACL|nr:hypothetical protein CGZ75_17540 [Paenibacillus herberti]